MSSLQYLFCHVDDFCRAFEPTWPERTGISFVDATKIQVCHNRRISNPKRV